MSRDVDTPDTIVSSSSPECVIPEYIHRFPGLRLIDEESDEESDWLKRVSPVIPIISPIPIRVKPGYLKDAAKQDKENLGSSRSVSNFHRTLSSELIQIFFTCIKLVTMPVTIKFLIIFKN